MIISILKIDEWVIGDYVYLLLDGEYTDKVSYKGNQNSDVNFCGPNKVK